MHLFFILLILLAVPSCILSQVTLDQVSSVQLKPSQTLRLTCKVSGFSLTTSGIRMNWIRQPPGKGLEWLSRMDWDDDKYYTNSLKTRLTISRDLSKSEVYLEMRGMETKDTGVYYCARGGFNWFDSWGQGTMVTVTSASPAAPVLFPLIPTGTLPQSGDVTIGCLAKDFLPDSITFSWDDQKNVSLSDTKLKRYPSILDASGTFTASSQASVSVVDWATFSPFYCKAEHASGNKVIKVVDKLCRGCTPDMIVRAPPVKAFSSSYLNSTVTCDAFGLPTQQATLEWFKDGERLESGFTTTKPVPDSQNCYSMRSELVVTKKDWLSDVKFSCTVQDKNYNNTLDLSLNILCLGNPGLCEPTEVRVDAIPPTYADIFETSSAKLTCRISNIPYDQDISELNVTWTQESDQKRLDTEYGQPIDQENGLQYIDATVTVCAADWNSGQAFHCKVSFPGVLPKPVEKQLKKIISGATYTPSVYILPPPSDQLALRESATLTCLVKGFYPEEIFLRWLHNDQPVSALQYFTSQPTQESKQPEKYFVYSMLNINEQDWSSGDTFSCLVGHETLPYNTTQKTVDKNTGKPSIVNVSLVLSDAANACY